MIDHCWSSSPGWTAWLAAARDMRGACGSLHGLVLFASLPLDLGLPFGGLDAIGAVVALLLWLYLFHVIVLVGYATAMAASSGG